MESIINYSIGILGILIGVIVSYYFYRRSLRVKEPVYSTRSINLISDYKSQYKNLNVSYKNKKIENITVTKVLFYNRGAETMNGQDLVTLNPLRICTTKSLLDARVLQLNNSASDFKVDLDRANQSLLISFDYLNQYQGAVIEVIHTGLSSDDVCVLGDIKGVDQIVAMKGYTSRMLQSGFGKHGHTVMATVVALLISFLLFIDIGSIFFHQYYRQWNDALGTSGELAYAFDCRFQERPTAFRHR